VVQVLQQMGHATLSITQLDEASPKLGAYVRRYCFWQLVLPPAMGGALPPAHGEIEREEVQEIVVIDDDDEDDPAPQAPDEEAVPPYLAEELNGARPGLDEDDRGWGAFSEADYINAFTAPEPAIKASEPAIKASGSSRHSKARVLPVASKAPEPAIKPSEPARHSQAPAKPAIKASEPAIKASERAIAAEPGLTAKQAKKARKRRRKEKRREEEKEKKRAALLGTRGFKQWGGARVLPGQLPCEREKPEKLQPGELSAGRRRLEEIKKRKRKPSVEGEDGDRGEAGGEKRAKEDPGAVEP
jgi:hypothetical protein